MPGIFDKGGFFDNIIEDISKAGGRQAAKEKKERERLQKREDDILAANLKKRQADIDYRASVQKADAEAKKRQQENYLANITQINGNFGIQHQGVSDMNNKLAEQGKTAFNMALGTVGQTMNNAGSTLFGPGGIFSGQEDYDTNDPKQKDNQMIMIAGVVVVALFMFMQMNKK